MSLSALILGRIRHQICTLSLGWSWGGVGEELGSGIALVKGSFLWLANISSEAQERLKVSSRAFKVSLKVSRAQKGPCYGFSVGQERPPVPRN